MSFARSMKSATCSHVSASMSYSEAQYRFKPAGQVVRPLNAFSIAARA